MAGKDLYAILGVARGAPADEIRKSFKKLARKLHPDVNPAGEEQFREVSAAYGVLSDPDKRKLYDEFGDVALQAGFDSAAAERMRQFGGQSPFDFGSWSQSFNQGSGGLDELLGSLFGGRRRGQRGPKRGRDQEVELKIDLPLSVRGGTATIRLDQPVEVKIPKGVREGQALRLAGLGQPGSGGGPAGDLLIRISVLEHSVYRREGDDLHVEVPVSLAEAIRGGAVEFEGPTGEVSIKLPPGTQSGQTFRLRGLGARKGGNLLARVLVTAPAADALRDEARAAELDAIAEQLASFYSDDLRTQVRF
ncbi:MAG: J domain-containing protein [Planctomycetes bacterium]|nr:J domain-containing protein [Planctomycetota bacterium]